MPSIRSQLLLFIMKNRHLLRGKLKPQSFTDGSTTLEEFRETVNNVPKHFGDVPNGITIEPIHIDKLYAEWLHLEGNTYKSTILYFHGGGYVAGNCRVHRMHVAKVVTGTSINALLFDYRLAPENPFPAALDDALTAYRYLLDTGYKPSHIAFMGDSAGGGLCTAALLAAKKAGLPMPAAAVALSPWLDVACTSDSYRIIHDPLSPKDSWSVFGRHYVGNNNPCNALISPLYGDLTGLPPLLLYVGEHEVYHDEAIRFTNKAKAAGVDIVLHVGKGMFHCYPICAPLFPEATEAMAELCDFLRAHVC